MPDTKVCELCKRPLPFDPLYFEIDIDQPDRLSKFCRPCELSWIKERNSEALTRLILTHQELT